MKNILDEEQAESKTERVTKFKMDPRAPQFIPKAQPVQIPEVNLSDQNRSNTLKELATLQAKQAEVSTLLVHQQRASHLPAKVPPVFTGDALDYPAFTSAFDSMISNNVQSNRDRLYFLENTREERQTKLLRVV